MYYFYFSLFKKININIVHYIPSLGKERNNTELMEEQYNELEEINHWHDGDCITLVTLRVKKMRDMIEELSLLSSRRAEFDTRVNMFSILVQLKGMRRRKGHWHDEEGNLKKREKLVLLLYFFPFCCSNSTLTGC